MIDQRLQNYITANLNNHISIDKIREALIAAGWQESLVEDALKSAAPNSFMKTLKIKSVESPSAKLAWTIVAILVTLIIVAVVSFVVYDNRGKENIQNASISNQLLINEVQEIKEIIDKNNCNDDIGCLLRGLSEGRQVYGKPSLDSGENLSIIIDEMKDDMIEIQLQDLQTMFQGFCKTNVETFSNFLNTWKRSPEDSMKSLKENADCHGDLFKNLEVVKEEVLEKNIIDIDIIEDDMMEE